MRPSNKAMQRVDTKRPAADGKRHWAAEPCDQFAFCYR